MAGTRRKVQGIVALAAVFGLLLAACGGGSGSNAKTGNKGNTLPACPPGTGKYTVTAYIANGVSGTVTPIDDATRVAGASITVGPAGTVTNPGPYDLAATPDGSAVWVAMQNAGVVKRVDTSSNTVTDTITVGSHPRGITVSPDGKFVLVANFGSQNVTLIDNTTPPKFDKNISVAPSNGPFDVVVDPSSKYAWVTDGISVDVRQIDIVNKMAVGTPTKISALGVIRIAMRPDGSRAYVTSPNNTVNDLRDVIPLKVSGAPPAIQEAAVALSQNNPQGNDGPADIITTHDGTTAYVTMLNGQRVIPMDLTQTPPDEKPPATYNQPPEVNVGGGALYGVDITPDDKTLYVPRSFSNDVVTVDVGASPPKVVGTPIKVGTSPDAVAVAAGCRNTTSSSSSTVVTTSTTIGGGNALPCPTIAPIPSGATNSSVKSVMWDGNGSHFGSLHLYELNGTWHARGEMQSKPFDDEVIDGVGPTMHAIGGYRINSDATEEGWANVGQGSSTDILTFFVYQNCKISQIQLNGSAALFPVGATTSAAQGVSCFGFNTGIEVFDTTSNNGNNYKGTVTNYTIQLGTTPKLIIGGAPAQVNENPSNGNSFQAISSFHCGNLTI